jgi:hypothetical protein
MSSVLWHVTMSVDGLIAGPEAQVTPVRTSLVSGCGTMRM